MYKRVISTKACVQRQQEDIIYRAGFGCSWRTDTDVWNLRPRSQGHAARAASFTSKHNSVETREQRSHTPVWPSPPRRRRRKRQYFTYSSYGLVSADVLNLELLPTTTWRKSCGLLTMFSWIGPGVRHTSHFKACTCRRRCHRVCIYLLRSVVAEEARYVN